MFRPEHQIRQQPSIESASFHLDETVRFAREAATRTTRLALLSAETDRLFPAPSCSDIRQEIRRSFDVPQWGPYHNEGMLLDTHLTRIFETIAALERGEVHPAISAFGRDVILSVGQGNNGDSLRRYALLHDLDKGNCLRLKLKEKSILELSWQEWCERLPEPQRTDPQALADHCRTSGIEAISYFHEEDKARALDKRKHGEVAASRLTQRAQELGISALVVTAIERHETFYQFTKVDPKGYQKRFQGLSNTEVAWVITASYCDAMSSLSPAGEPGISYLQPLLATIDDSWVGSTLGLSQDAC